MSETIKFKNAESILNGDVQNSIAPAGYVKINLSTKGQISEAPKSVFARAMTSAEVLSLSMYIKDELQGPLIGVLDSIIYKTDEEPVASVAKWTPEEVIEFTIKYYSNFFGQTMKDISYIPIEKELEILEKENRTVELESLKNGTWNPVINLDLSKINYIKLDKSISKRLVITSKKHPDFKVSFRFPYYGDILLINEVFNAMEEDNTDKTVLAALLSNAVLLDKINDTDVSVLPLKDRLNMLMSDPKFSLGLLDKLNEKLEKIKFGVDEEVEIISPITKKPLSRRFQFRIVDVLSALLLPDSDGYDIQFE